MRKISANTRQTIEVAVKVYSGGLQNRATKKMLLAAVEYKRAWKTLKLLFKWNVFLYN